MKANELRIGNYIYSEIDKCNKIDNGFIQLDPTALAYLFDVNDDFKRLKPIQLTEQLLLDFGFDNLIHEDEFLELIYNDTIGYRLSIDGQYAYSEIKYVHQLQNLYFALTEKELPKRSSILNFTIKF